MKTLINEIIHGVEPIKKTLRLIKERPDWKDFKISGGGGIFHELALKSPLSLSKVVRGLGVSPQEMSEMKDDHGLTAADYLLFSDMFGPVKDKDIHVNSAVWNTLKDMSASNSKYSILFKTVECDEQVEKSLELLKDFEVLAVENHDIYKTQLKGLKHFLTILSCREVNLRKLLTQNKTSALFWQTRSYEGYENGFKVRVWQGEQQTLSQIIEAAAVGEFDISNTGTGFIFSMIDHLIYSTMGNLPWEGNNFNSFKKIVGDNGVESIALGELDHKIEYFSSKLEAHIKPHKKAKERMCEIRSIVESQKLKDASSFKNTYQKKKLL